MILLQYVMHLGDVLTGHGLDDEPVVVAGQEAVPEATLGVAVERSAPRERVLQNDILQITIHPGFIIHNQWEITAV